MDGQGFSQQVNLYLPEYRPRRDWLTAGRFMALMLCVVALVAALSGVDYLRRYLLQQEQADTQRVLTAQTRVTEQLERDLASMATDASLLAEVKTRQDSLAQLEGTLATLQNLGQGNITGFSEYLKNMSQASFEGMWLTRISITEAGAKARLEGRAQEGAMVPRFVDRLSSGWSEAEGWSFTRISSSLGGANQSALVDAAATTDGDPKIAAVRREIERIDSAVDNYRGALDQADNLLDRAEGVIDRASGLRDGGSRSVPRAQTQAPETYNFVLEARNGR